MCVVSRRISSTSSIVTRPGIARYPLLTKKATCSFGTGFGTLIRDSLMSVLNVLPATQDRAWKSAGWLAVSLYCHAVYEDVRNPFRVSERVLERRYVANGLRVEEDEIRSRPRLHHSAVLQAEPFGGLGRHFINGGLQGNHALLPDVVT